MRTLDVPKSGKRGQVIASRNHYGPYERAYVRPKDPRTAKQLTWRKAWAYAAKAWGNLTEEQREAWNRAARRVRSRVRLGFSARLTGQAYFMKINARRKFDGKALLLLPPAE